MTERTIGWVKEDFTKFGLTLDAFSDLPNRIEEIRGKGVPVVKHGGGDFGVHIQRPGKGR